MLGGVRKDESGNSRPSWLYQARLTHPEWSLHQVKNCCESDEAESSTQVVPSPRVGKSGRFRFSVLALPALALLVDKPLEAWMAGHSLHQPHPI